MIKQFLLLPTFLLFLFTQLSFAQNAPGQPNMPQTLEYNLQPGMDLIFTATFDLSVEGDISEQSTRVIESRFIVMDMDDSGNANLFGISKMVLREQEGQIIDAPYGNIYAYQWDWNPKTGAYSIPSTSAEFGTGWTPLVNFSPLPKQPVALNERLPFQLPLYINMSSNYDGSFFVLTQPHPVKPGKLSVASSLSQPLLIQMNPRVMVEFLENEVTYNPAIGLPEETVTAYQLHMQDGATESYADIRIESSLTQSNKFMDQHLPVIRQEIDKFFVYQQQLNRMKIEQADEIIDLLVQFSENSPMPLLRDAAQDLVLKHRFELRLNENLQQSQVGWEARPFNAETVMGEDYTFYPKSDKVRVLVFWSLWWQPAEQALLDLEELRKSLNPEKVEFVGINLDSNDRGIRQYLLRTEIGMKTLWDQNYPRSGTAFLFGVQQVPVIIVVEKDGVIAARDIPFQELVDVLSDML